MSQRAHGQQFTQDRNNVFKFTDACIFYGWIKSELGQTFHTNIFPRVSMHYAATNLKASSALGEKGDKNRREQKKKKKKKKLGERPQVASHEFNRSNKMNV